MASATPCRSPRTSVTSAASMAASVPLPIAMPTSACASAGASLMPSPTMATTTFPPAWSFLISSLLPSGSTSARTRVDAHLPRYGFGGAVGVAGEHDDFQPHAAQPRHGCRRVAFHRVGHGDQTRVLPVDADEHRRPALGGETVGGGFVGRQAAFAQEPRVADEHRPAFHGGLDPVSRDRAEIDRCGERKSSFPGGTARWPRPADVRCRARRWPPGAAIGLTSAIPGAAVRPSPWVCRG